ncbi:tRNA-splicing endonuclease subunit Sen2-1-like isoform X2 [Nymphaea colorata]|nr:tRNA-splicing endonuclease subunit Sen2-1-like isoform X2 [Nymphaea colorata]
MRPRWKGKGSAQLALADPMSKIVSKLQSCLTESKSCASLSNEVVLCEAEPEQAELLNRACFGRPMATVAKGRQWFQLGLEEAFYLSNALNCLTVVGEDGSPKDPQKLAKCMKDRQSMFPMMYKAYSHLRMKNWVVRPGSQYGVDFVVYRHHPALVHSEYAALVVWDGDDEFGKARMRVWSDWHCMLRLCGSVAKSLLVLSISGVNSSNEFPACLDEWTIEEYTIGRWEAQQHREDEVPLKVENKCRTSSCDSNAFPDQIKQNE